MRVDCLADTGALLALLDRADRWHDACADAFRSLRLPLATSEAVLAELFHLVGDDERESGAAWGLLRSGAITLLSILDEDLPAVEELMVKYRDRPMDFADATLVHLARRESIANVFTVDHRHFSTYRLAGKKRFRIFPTIPGA